MFHGINQQALPAFQSLPGTMAYAEIQRRLEAFRIALNAPRMRFSAHPLLFDRNDYEQLVDGLQLVASGLQRVVDEALRRHARSDLLQLMGVDPAWAPLVDWEQLRSGQHRVMRADLLPCADGMRICELNFSAAVGGFELFEHYRAFADVLGWDAEGSQAVPVNNLASMYARSIVREGYLSLHLLDWSTHSAMGYPSGDLSQQWLRRSLPGLDISVHDERSWRHARRSGMDMSRTLVHRRFTYDDVLSDHDVYLDILDSGARFSNGLEAELLMSKAWLALLWDEGYRQVLTPMEWGAVQRWVVPTHFVTVDDVAALNESDSNIVFKKKYGYGGQDVVPSGSAAAALLARRLSTSGAGDWVQQPMLDVPELVHLDDRDLGLAPHRTVVGVYLHEGATSGCVVRSAVGNRVVNASSGASIGWAPVLNSDERGAFLEKFSALA